MLYVDSGVPDVEKAHGRGAGDGLAVGRGSRSRRRLLFLRLVAVVAGGDDEAGDEALDVPLERRRKRLVEVIEIEHRAPVGGSEHAEVGEVSVTAALHAESVVGVRDRSQAMIPAPPR